MEPVSGYIYIDDIESVQKQFVIYLLGSRRDQTSFRIAPYCDRCKLLNIQPLELRRNIADTILAFDLYKNIVSDDSINAKFVATTTNRITRNRRLLKEASHRTEYLRKQPINRIIVLINKFASIIDNTNSRNVFKTQIVKALTNEMNQNES